MNFREEPNTGDLLHVSRILEERGIFRANEIAVALELVQDRIDKGKSSEYMFLFMDGENELDGFACYGPISVTQSCYDLYWIAVRKGSGRSGIGGRMMEMLCKRARGEGGTWIFAETSTLEGYAPAREFYLKSGFGQTCTVPDFYAPGDGKIIFRKALGNVPD